MGNSLNDRSTRRSWLRRSAGLSLAVAVSRDALALSTTRTCRQNLHAIYDAVMAYRRLRDGLPSTLSSLVDLQLIDRRLLICPVHSQRGTNSPTNPLLANAIATDPLTLYSWEYADAGGDDSSAAFHEKQRRMGAGDWVPLVRCGEHPDHGPMTHLNLALNGGIYPSGNLWEHQLRDIVPFPYLYAASLIHAEPLVPLKERIPPRSPQAGTQQLDLTEAFNGALDDPWPDGYAGEEAPELLRLAGENRLLLHEGIAFEVRGVIQLEGSHAAAEHETEEPRFPFRRSATVTGQGVAVHLLCGVIRPLLTGTPAMRIELQTHDGATHEITLRHGVHVVHGRELSQRENASIVWSRDAPGPGNTAAVSVSHVIWELDRSANVRKLQFSAPDNACYPFVLAATLA